MTRSLPHSNTITKTFEGVFGVEIWKTPYLAANLELYNTCPINWGMISSCSLRLLPIVLTTLYFPVDFDMISTE